MRNFGAAEPRHQRRVAAVAIPIGFFVGCVWNMLAQQLSLFAAVRAFTSITLSHGIGEALVWVLMCYFNGMVTLFVLVKLGSMASNLLGTQF
ncbi:hypothetical protein [Gymnodinialimonas ceratoperidinii]|uniref:Uncharacterized protein n=1 Tax=Gymnodinialimonas ceratoperidinii TaxID=2856823 RepID=A0A8F6TTR4_9RHOB|nr:hypothetical protein [Gymnodinialimonas ceratoperidinii]QXT38520.1 hypothetical protein KYE46_11280 [Gymnodinialimonas ceratoperidinii]